MGDRISTQPSDPWVSTAQDDLVHSEKGKTVLIADDNPENLSVLGRMLEHAGLRVRIARDGEQALASALAERPDIAVLDVHMPRMDGYETCRKLLAHPHLSRLPVLFISALSDPFNKAQAFAAGAVDYMEKPFQFEEVLIRIRNALRLGYYMRRCDALEARLNAQGVDFPKTAADRNIP